MQVSHFDVVKTVLSANVAPGSSFSVPYPSGHSKGLYVNGLDHRIAVEKLGGEEYRAMRGDVTFDFSSASVIMITNRMTGRATFPQGSVVHVQLDRPGINGEMIRGGQPDKVRTAVSQIIDFGSPAASNNVGLAASQSVALNGKMVLTAAAKALDFPRNIVGAWTGTAICTVRGRDEFGKKMTEKSASGVTFTGKKAFASVEEIQFSAAVTLATAGWGNVFGLPVFLSRQGAVQNIVIDGGAPDATKSAEFIVGEKSDITATSGDVRGTWTPSAAVSGLTHFEAQILIDNPYMLGKTQYADF
jgi:hypothetical protein